MFDMFYAIYKFFTQIPNVINLASFFWPLLAIDPIQKRIDKVYPTGTVGWVFFGVCYVFCMAINVLIYKLVGHPNWLGYFI